MEIMDYEREEAITWLRKNQDNGNTMSQDLAEYGRRLYNQRGNDDINTILQLDIPPITKDYIIGKLKQLER